MNSLICMLHAVKGVGTRKLSRDKMAYWKLRSRNNQWTLRTFRTICGSLSSSMFFTCWDGWQHNKGNSWVAFDISRTSQVSHDYCTTVEWYCINKGISFYLKMCRSLLFCEFLHLYINLVNLTSAQIYNAVTKLLHMIQIKNHYL